MNIRSFLWLMVCACCCVQAQNQDLTLTQMDRSVSEQKRNDLTIFSDPALSIRQIGALRPVASAEITSSRISIGFEGLDRQNFDPSKCYEKLAQTGVKWARCQTGWNRCETVKGQYDFAWLDEVVDNLLQRGVQPWFNVGFGNKLYMPEAYGEAVGWVPLYFGDEVKQAWGNYVKALATHFKGRVSHYELWNEPNIRNFWQPGKPDAQEYLNLIAYSSTLIKQADPQAKVGACVSGSLSAYVVSLVKLGVSDYIDFFSIHPYRIIPEKGYEKEITALRALFDANGGKQVELWQGEVGFGSYFPPNHFLHTWTRGSESLQAKWLLRRVAADLALDLKMSSFFQMVDMNMKVYQTSEGPQDPCLHGILHGWSYEPKQAYYAIRHAAAIFDADLHPSPYYFNIGWDRYNPVNRRVSRLPEVAAVMNSYQRQDYPVYVYYLPEDVQMQTPGVAGIDIYTLEDAPKKIDQPVLIDLLSGRVFAVVNEQGDWQKGSLFKGLPLLDYPLVLTDFKAMADRIALDRDSADLSHFPQGYDPKEVGVKLGKQFLQGKHLLHDGKWIHYAEVCTWLGALRFAEVAHDPSLLAQLQKRFEPLFGKEKQYLPIQNHVDLNMFGCLPLELYQITKQPKYLDLGLPYADSQWQLPTGADAQQQAWAQKGYSWQTRLWIDDMFMITILQTQAYRATGQVAYLQRAAKEMAYYLDTLQRTNGLFYHAPDVPFYWARGNGWMAASMTELLKVLPDDDPNRPRIMEGYKLMMQGLKHCQNQEGLWNQLIDQPDFWTETSGSAMFAYAIITGIKQGWLDAQVYGSTARKAWLAMAKYLDNQGNVREVCVGTNKLADKQYYYDRPRIAGDYHGQAPYFWCMTALLE